MAIIYSYPYVNTVNNSDTLVISVSDTTADNGFLTKSLTADNLASYVTARVNLNFLGDTGTGVVNLDTQNLSITGTANEIETSASSQTLQIGLPDSVTITNNLTVGSDFTGDRGTFANDLNVGADLSVVSGAVESSTLQVNSTAFIGGVLTMEDNISMTQNGRITDLEDPINAQDAVTKSYIDGLVSGGLSFRGSFRADTGEILSGANSGSYLYNCPGGAGTRVSVITGDYYIVANTGGQFYCSGDLLNVGDSVIAVADAAADSSTVNDWATLESDNIEGTGLANTIPLWTDSQVLGNSMLSQNAGATILTVAGNINSQGVVEGESLEIRTGPSTITGELDKDSFKIINLADPTAAQDAATKAYVDAVDLDFTGNSGTGNVQQGSTFDILGSGPITTSASGTTLTINSSAAEGTGTTNTLPIWSDGPNGILGDSAFTQTFDTGGNVKGAYISLASTPNAYFFGPQEFSSPEFNFKIFANVNGGYYRSGNFRFEKNLAVGRTNDPILASLDVGTSTQSIPAAFFRNGVVISNNPAGVQVDNTSMVIGAGNNDNVSGSDHCLIVGSGNQITSNSDQSVAFGQGNSITNSTDAFAVGNSNTVASSQRTLVLGYQNSVDSESSFIAGGNNTVNNGDTKIVLGYNNLSSGNNNFAVGNEITIGSGEMVLGFRNSPSQYPSTDINNGLSEVKFVVATGASNSTNSNALLITAGGKNGGNPAVPQIPRVILPTVPTFSASNDAAADAIGVPQGALYQNNGVVQVNRGGGSTTDPLAGIGGAWTTLEVNLSGNVLVNAFNGNLSDAITLVTVPANHFAKILEVTGVIYGASSGTTSYNSNNSLYVKRVGSTTGGSFSAPEILGSFINTSSDQLTNSNGQPVAAQVNALSAYGGLGADIVLGPSTTGPVTITQGDRTIKLSVTYRLIDFTP